MSFVNFMNEYFAPQGQEWRGEWGEDDMYGVPQMQYNLFDTRPDTPAPTPTPQELEPAPAETVATTYAAAPPPQPFIGEEIPTSGGGQVPTVPTTSAPRSVPKGLPRASVPKGLPQYPRKIPTAGTGLAPRPVGGMMAAPSAFRTPWYTRLTSSPWQALFYSGVAGANSDVPVYNQGMFGGVRY